MLLAQSRHSSIRSLERYARPGPEAVARHVARTDPAVARSGRKHEIARGRGGACLIFGWGRPSRSPCARGLDVLVEPEEVVRVVGRFDTRQAVEIDAVGVPNPVAALLTEVVDVHAVEVRAHGVEEFAGPSHVGWRVGGVVPL